MKAKKDKSVIPPWEKPGSGRSGETGKARKKTAASRPPEKYSGSGRSARKSDKPTDFA